MKRYTHAAKREAVTEELQKDPSRSNNSLAKMLGVTAPFVLKVRRELNIPNPHAKSKPRKRR